MARRFCLLQFLTLDNQCLRSSIFNKMEAEKGNLGWELTENGGRFWKTFTEAVAGVDPGWIERMGKKGKNAVFFSLGCGASDAETIALTVNFPEAVRIAVDINPDSKPLAEFYGFSFLEASADDPNIYNQGGKVVKPDLVVIRNPSPANKEMWEEAIKLAWKNMADGGILYLSSSYFDKHIISGVLSIALGVDKDDINKKWQHNPHALDSAFRDDYVVCFQKRLSQN